MKNLEQFKLACLHLLWQCKWRLEQGTFQFPTDGKAKEELAAGVEITTSQLSLLRGGIDLRSAKQRKRFVAPRNPK